MRYHLFQKIFGKMVKIKECLSSLLRVCTFLVTAVQPNHSWKRNTAKSCTEYSQNICSVGISYSTSETVKEYVIKSWARSELIFIIALYSTNVCD